MSVINLSHPCSDTHILGPRALDLPTCISCNMGTRDLPDMYAQKPEGRRPEG